MGAATTRPARDVGMITGGGRPESGSEVVESGGDDASSGTAGPPLSLRRGPARLVSPGHRVQRRDQVGPELVIRLGRRRRKRTHDHVSAGESDEFCPDEFAQPAPHLVADHGRADRLGHHETDARRRLGIPSSQMDDQTTAPGAATTADDGREVVSPPQALICREHGQPYRLLRPKGGRALWRDARREWRDRHGCACAAGTRGSWHADGCSAGTCACSLSMPSVQSRSAGRSDGSTRDAPHSCSYAARTWGDTVNYIRVLGGR
jgi:hypothetical protein